MVELVVIRSSTVLGCLGREHRRWFWPSLVLLDGMFCRFGWLWVAGVGWSGCWCCLRFVGSAGAAGDEWVRGRLESVPASRWRAAVARVFRCRRLGGELPWNACCVCVGACCSL